MTLESFGELAKKFTGELGQEEEEPTPEQKILRGVTPLTPAPSQPLEPRLDLARVRGGFVCTCLGDALGVPHEFPRMGKRKYTGVLEYRFKFIRQWGLEPIVFGVGQVSDDSEMMITLSRRLIADTRYDWKAVVKDYIKWAHSGMAAMGTNTSELFKKANTTRKDPTGVQHYEKKFTAKFGVYGGDPWVSSTADAERAQSNGSLMRCFPLACIWLTKPLEHDVWISNPSHVNLECEAIYIQCLRLAMLGKPAREIWEEVKDLPTLDPVKQVFSDVANGVSRTLADEVVEVAPEIPGEGISDVVKGKGKGKGKRKGKTEVKKVRAWVCHGLYAAISCLYALAAENPPSFGELMDWVIGGHPGSDTDTNAAIAGGLIGAIIGWDELIKGAVGMDQLPELKDDPNYERIKQASTFVYNVGIMLTAGKTDTDMPRPAEYRLEDAENVVQGLWYLSAYH